MEKRQTGVHWKVLWEVLGKLTKTLEKGNFAVEQEVYDITEDTKVAVALGTKWVLVKDTLKVKLQPTRSIQRKRNILGQTASYNNLFGMLSGLLVRP